MAVAADVGLSSAEVAERIADGRVNRAPEPPGRTTAQILRANVINPVNAIVGFMLVLIVIADGIGPDMLFGFVIVANSLIGSAQELQARAALNRLAVLNTPRALAVRDGTPTDIAVEAVVADDLLLLGPGAQVVVDGAVCRSDGLEVNESLLTGEIDPVPKGLEAEVLSGSFVSSGSGAYRATRVGGDSYANRLADEARQFTLVRSELRDGVNTILRFLMFALPPVAILLLWRLLDTSDDWRDALSGTVAAGVAMVPDGLVLLTSIAFAAGVVKLSRRNALLRELASVELLARVDTLCLDKTGTITTGEISVAETRRLDDAVDPAPLLAALAKSDPFPNATSAAMAAAFADPPAWSVADTVPFSSSRKWSAVSFRADQGAADRGAADDESPRGALYLGAPEILAPDDERVQAEVAEQADLGRRVVLLASAAALHGDDLPDDLHPLAIVLLEDRIRSDAAETLTYMAAQGVDLKVISGDHPATVAAVVRRAGLPDAADGVDARGLPTDDAAFADAVETTTVFGRVTPQQKRSMVKALQSRGRVVAMTGDGVNDVLALKDSDMGIAMGAGSAASRAVAQLVLLDNRFSVLPGVLAEGRRVINSVERAANLFIYGTVYSVFMALTIAVVGTDYPFLPRHLTIVRTLSVGVPGVFLALAPDSRGIRPGFLGRVVRFAIPAGVTAAIAALTTYFVCRGPLDTGLAEARTMATVCLLGVGLAILIRLTGSLPRWRWGLVAAMAAGLAAALFVPGLSTYFALEPPSGNEWWVVLGCVAAAAVVIQFVPVTSDGEAAD